MQCRFAGNPKHPLKWYLCSVTTDAVTDVSRS